MTEHDSRRAAFPWRAVASVFAATLLVRAAAVAAQFPLLNEDPDGYRRLAITLRQTGTFGLASPGHATRDGEVAVRPTAFRPPLYPILLALLVRDAELPSAAVAVFHVILGAATAAMTYLLARQARLDIAAYLAAALVAFDPILLRQSALVMTETLAAFLAVCGIAALAWFRAKPSWRRAAAAGIVMGFAMLCRPTFAPWIVLVAAAVLLSRSIPNRFRHAGAMLLSAAMVAGPWAARNAVRFDAPIFTTTHGGYTLWLANNDAFYDHLKRREGVFDAERSLAPRLAEIRAETGDDEADYDRRLSREAIETIRRRSGDFALATLDRLHSLWRLTPRQTTGSESTRRMAARAAVGVWYAAVFTLAVVGLWRRRRELATSPWLWGLLLCLAFTMVHSLYWTDMRMRAPLMPVVALAAAAGAQRRKTKQTWRTGESKKLE